MTSTKNNVYSVIRDTKEKEGHGWFFQPNYRWCSGTTCKSLKTGDYTLEGQQDYLVIERKGSITEWAQNLIQKRFEKELVRLSIIKHAYILLEFDIEDVIWYPKSVPLPPKIKKRIKIDGRFILKKMLEIEMKYGVHIWFCGQYGKDVAEGIFKRYLGL